MEQMFAHVLFFPLHGCKYVLELQAVPYGTKKIVLVEHFQFRWMHNSITYLQAWCMAVSVPLTTLEVCMYYSTILGYTRLKEKENNCHGIHSRRVCTQKIVISQLL